MEKVDQFIDQLPSKYKKVASTLREIINSSSPAIEEKYSYKVPFYYYLGPLCYINSRKDHIYLGFVYGNQLEDEYNVLEAGDRKQVRIISYYTMNELSRDVLMFYVNQAMILNELKRN